MIITPIVFFADDGGDPIELTLIGQANANSATVTLPVGSTTGDLTIFLQGIRNEPGNLSLGLPSGYERMASIAPGSNDMASQACYKVLTGGETNIVTGSTGGTGIATFVLVYRPSRPISSVTYSTWLTTRSGGNPAAQVIAMAGQDVPIVGLALGAAEGGSWNFTTNSPPFDDTPTRSAGSQYSRMGYKLYNSSPADHTVDYDDEGANNTLISGWIRVE